MILVRDVALLEHYAVGRGPQLDREHALEVADEVLRQALHADLAADAVVAQHLDPGMAHTLPKVARSNFSPCKRGVKFVDIQMYVYT